MKKRRQILQRKMPLMLKPKPRRIRLKLIKMPLVPKLKPRVKRQKLRKIRKILKKRSRKLRPKQTKKLKLLRKMPSNRRKKPMLMLTPRLIKRRKTRPRQMTIQQRPVRKLLKIRLRLIKIKQKLR